MRPFLLLLLTLVIGPHSAGAQPAPPAPASELDAFMAQVLARRDENWRKLQQYVLDERERAALAGPGGVRLFGLARDYTWYIRDGAFVRSPVRFDGVPLGEEQRLEYEREWLEREAERAKARAEREGAPRAGAPTDLDAQALATLTREPQFVSMAYFLKFKFEPGHYAFAGREDYEGHSAYRIEYYPSRLFADDEKPGEPAQAHDATEDRLQRQMNKVAAVTLWIEPDQRQVLRYTFRNLGMDFLPGRSVVRIDDLRASMRMVEAFPGVWLPGGIDGEGRLTLASGTYTFTYRTEYEGYRAATVKARIR
jgi:hypothetical protein